MDTATIDYISAAALFDSLSPAGAVDAIEAALRADLDPADDVPRSILEVAHGQLLVMPAQSPNSSGVKVVTVARGNAERGLPRIQGVYVLFDAETLTPHTLLDGTALTTLRTPAVSVAAVHTALTQRARPLNLCVFGAGPQGVGHAETIADVVGADRIASTTYVVRTPERATIPSGRLVGAGTPEAAGAVADADVIVCATSAGTPVFDSSATKSDVIVMAVGSHDGDRREVDGAFVGRAQVVVEDIATALREAGDVVLAVAEGRADRDNLMTMRAVIRGESVLDPTRPVLFKGSGMSWEDVVVADAVAAAHRARRVDRASGGAM